MTLLRAVIELQCTIMRLMLGPSENKRKQSPHSTVCILITLSISLVYNISLHHEIQILNVEPRDG